MSKIRILLVDDNDAVLRAVWQMLEDEFNIIAAVCDSTCLLKTANEFGADVIVLDVSMPGIDGIELARRLKEQGCPSRTLFLTVQRSPKILEAALASGALGYVVKSRAGDDLIPAIYKASRGEAFVSPSLESPRLDQ